MAVASLEGRKGKRCLALHPDQASSTEQVLRDGKSGGVCCLFHLCFLCLAAPLETTAVHNCIASAFASVLMIGEVLLLLLLAV